MGNLMGDRSRAEELYSRYQGFLVPAARLLVGEGGRDLSRDLNGQIDNLNVTLTSETSSSVSFSIVNAYDYKNHSFNKDILDQLCLGSILKVELGYGSSLEKVFTGFIYSVKASFGGTAELQVTAVDVRRAMGDAVRKGVVWKYTTYSDVFKQVMEPYKKLYSKLVIDKTSDNSFESMTQNESDMDFVKILAAESNREFFVLDDVVYFRRKAKRSPSLTLNWGKDLISFSKESIYGDQKITVLGMIKGGKEQVMAAETVKTESNTRQIITSEVIQAISSPSSDTKDKAAQKAAKKAEKLRKKKQSGQGVCVGLPQLIPGRPVAVAGLASQINGEYTLKSVIHTFGSDGFQTSFEIGGFG